MPSVKIAKKSTDTDMTPFVDIAFLILSFFIMATKIKAPEPIRTTPPHSVSSKDLPVKEAIYIVIDDQNRVFLNIPVENGTDKIKSIISNINTARGLNLTAAQMDNFAKVPMVGAPLSQLGTLLSLSDAQRAKVIQPGIPVTDTLNNELEWWVGAARTAFAGGKLKFMIKGDEKSKFPTFEGVVNALRKNEEYKYFLVTSQEQAPAGTEMYNAQQRGDKIQ